MNRKELAEAMIKGINAPGVRECDYLYASKKEGLCMVCALGAALVGKLDSNPDRAIAAWKSVFERRTEDGPIVAMSDLLDVSASLAEEVELKHCDGVSILEIAAWLKEESCQ